MLKPSWGHPDAIDHITNRILTTLFFYDHKDKEQCSCVRSPTFADTAASLRKLTNATTTKVSDAALAAGQASCCSLARQSKPYCGERRIKRKPACGAQAFAWASDGALAHNNCDSHGYSC